MNELPEPVDRWLRRGIGTCLVLCAGFGLLAFTVEPDAINPAAAFLLIGALLALLRFWLRRDARRTAEAAAKLTSRDPEPPVCTVVEDVDGHWWHRYSTYPGSWCRVDTDGDSESWTKVAGNYGPVTVVGSQPRRARYRFGGGEH